jgi:hypothetical protein
VGIDIDAKPYEVVYPYLSVKVGEYHDGNAILYRGLYFAVKRRYEELTDQDRKIVKDTYESAMHEPGVINRGEKFHADEWQSFDDYFGLIYSCHITGEFGPALDIYNHGIENNWVFKNKQASFFKAWFGRVPGFVGMVKMAVRKELNWFDQFYVALSLLNKNTESGVQKAWLIYDLYNTQPHKYNLVDWACKKFEGQVAEKYPHKMGSVFEIYFGKDYFLTKWAMGRM